ncbi:MAG: Pathogenesis-related transcriptional factor and ERF protein, partial [Bacteroidota bacterium]
MSRQLTLKNSDRMVLIDEQVYAELGQDFHLREIKFLDNLRLHSSGCVVFQKTYKRTDGTKGYRTETIYLHKLIAERYLADDRVGENNLVGSRNGNKLDCRLANLEYRS